MKSKNFTLVPAAATTIAPLYPAVLASMTANITSQPISLWDYQGIALQAVWTGTPTGTLKLQCSCDPISAAPTNWTDITSSTQSLAGAAGNYVWNLFDVYYSWLQVVYLFSSGTGTLSVTASAKGFG